MNKRLDITVVLDTNIPAFGCILNALEMTIVQQLAANIVEHQKHGAEQYDTGQIKVRSKSRIDLVVYAAHPRTGQTHLRLIAVDGMHISDTGVDDFGRYVFRTV